LQPPLGLGRRAAELAHLDIVLAPILFQGGLAASPARFSVVVTSITGRRDCAASPAGSLCEPLNEAEAGALEDPEAFRVDIDNDWRSGFRLRLTPRKLEGGT